MESEICCLPSNQWNSEAVPDVKSSHHSASKSRTNTATAAQTETALCSGTLELPLALGRLQGGAELLQVLTLHLVHEVEKLPEHLDRKRAKGHLRHKQPNAESAQYKQNQES